MYDNAYTPVGGGLRRVDETRRLIDDVVERMR
jgi:hypothetical protein